MLLTFIPYNVHIPAFFMSGLMTAFIVTPTDQNDEFSVTIKEKDSKQMYRCSTCYSEFRNSREHFLAFQL